MFGVITIEVVVLITGTHCLDLWYPHPLLISLKIDVTTNGQLIRITSSLANDNNYL